MVLTVREALNFIQTECYNFEVKREQWEAERNEFQNRINFLESENERYKTLNFHLSRRISMLELALKQERNVKNTENVLLLSVETPQNTTKTEMDNSLNEFIEIRKKQHKTVQGLIDDLNNISNELTTLLKLQPEQNRSAAENTNQNNHKKLEPEMSVQLKNDIDSWNECASPLLTARKIIPENNREKITSPKKPEIQKSRPSPSEIKPEEPTEKKVEVSKKKENNLGNDLLANLADALMNEDTFSDAIPSDKSFVSWKQILTVRGHFDSIRSIEFHPELPVLLSASDDCTLKLWNIKNYNSTKIQVDSFHTYYGHSKPILKTALHRMNGFFSCGVDKLIMHWQFPDLENAEPFACYGKAISHRNQVLSGHTDAVWDICVHENSDLLFSASADGTVKFWKFDENSHSCYHTLSYPSDASNAHTPTTLCNVKTNTDSILIGYNSSVILQADIETGSILQTIKSPNFTGSPNTHQQINQIITHPILPMAFTAHEDRYIRYFDLRTGECAISMVAHLDSVSSLAIDPAGSHLFSGGHDSSLRIWDIANKTCAQELMANRKKFDESIQCIAVHPTLNLLASSGADATIKFLRKNLSFEV